MGNWQFLGGFLVILATVSLLVELVLVLGGWVAIWPAIGWTTGRLSEAQASVATVDSLLANTASAVDGAAQSIAGADAAVRTAVTSLTTAGQSLDAAATLIGTDLPRTLEATSAALTSAQNTARGIDDALAALARVPLLGLDYRPDVPLATSLGQFNAALTPLPASLRTNGANLRATGATLGPLASEIERSAAGLPLVATSLEGVARDLRALRPQVSAAAATLGTLRGLAPVVMIGLLAAVTMLCLWLGVVQLQAMSVGARWAGWNLPLPRPPL